MKKLTCLLLCLLCALSLCACGTTPELSPAEKLEQYIMANGTQSSGVYTLDCADATALITGSEFTVAAMGLKATPITKFSLVKSNDGLSIALTDSALTDTGLKVDRYVSMDLDGTYSYHNGLVMNGANITTYLDGELAVSTYTKQTDSVITKSQLPSGASMTDAVKSTLKDYLNLTLDCFAAELAKDELGLTLADFGFAAYPGA